MSMDHKELDRLLFIGLEHWRMLRLRDLEEDLAEYRQDFLAAQDGLAIARENPGEIQEDVINYLWEELGNSAEQLAKLEAEHNEVMEMDVPRLLVTFQRRKKARWAFLH